MSKWAHLGRNTKRWTINSFTYNEENVKTTSLCPYVLMSKWAYLGSNTKRWTTTALTYSLVNLLTCLLVNLPNFVNLSVKILTRWVHFLPPIVRLAAKNRFSRGFVLVQKGGGCTCRQNEFLFKLTATNTHCFAICSEIQCVLPLNAVQNGAKRSAFWC